MSFSIDDFAKALEDHDYQFQVGSKVRGTVHSHDASGVYVDIGGKSAAFLPLREVSLDPEVDLATVLPLQEEREFLIVRDQDANGQMVLSIRQLEIKQAWNTLLEMQANNETLDVRVSGVNKGGVTADVKGLRGFIPRSHLVEREDLDALVGQVLTVSFLEVSPDRKKLVLSNRMAAKAAAMSSLERGQLIEGTVAALKPFGAFISFEGTTGLLHIKQISEKYVSSLPDLLEVGQSIKAVIMEIDEARGRIALSTRVLEKHPGEILDNLSGIMEDAENRAQSIDVLAERD